MPPLAGASAWLNSEPLGPAELRGHVVLVNFWTWTCINWLRQEPYVRAWSQAYRDDGLVVLGVHTPEFSFEHDVDGVRRATEERAIDYPVAVDNDYAIWNAFANRYWPALYFVDADGIIRDQHFGEGRYEGSERVIQRLLGVERELVSVEGVGVEAAADWDHLYTPETYLGYGRSGRSNHWMLEGEWAIEPEYVVLDQAGGRITCRFHARDAHLVLSPGTRGPIPSTCISTVSRRARRTASTSTRTATAFSETAACTNSCASTTPSALGRWRSRSSSRAHRRTRSRSASDPLGSAPPQCRLERLLAVAGDMSKRAARRSPRGPRSASCRRSSCPRASPMSVSGSGWSRFTPL